MRSSRNLGRLHIRMKENEILKTLYLRKTSENDRNSTSTLIWIFIQAKFVNFKWSLKKSSMVEVEKAFSNRFELRNVGTFHYIFRLFSSSLPLFNFLSKKSIISAQVAQDIKVFPIFQR